MRRSYDVVIVGGGIIGCAVAYFLGAREDFDGSVLVIERDPSYRFCSTTRSAASIRQQFSTPGNVDMSAFGAEFLARAPELLATGDEVLDMVFKETGYLFLATAAALPALRAGQEMQTARGAQVAYLSPADLADRYPWLETEGLAGATLGLKHEGSFDAHGFFEALRRKARALGTDFVADTAAGFRLAAGRLTAVRLAGGGEVACDCAVNAAGPQARAVAALAGIALPVHARKRSLFIFACQSHLPDCPLVVLPEGAAFRPEGRYFLGSIAPPPEQDLDSDDFDPHYDLFESILWPTLAAWVPAFEAIKLVDAWAGHYAFNMIDQNAILGLHPALANFYFANGFSGHGLQHAPAVGRGLAELIATGAYQTLELSDFGFARFITGGGLDEGRVI